MSIAAILKEKQVEYQKLGKQVAKLEDIAWAAENKTKIKKFKGKFFKYKNCYSDPQKPSDYWYLYVRVLERRVDRWAPFTVEEFQIDSRGRVDWKINTTHSDLLDNQSYVPCSIAEYNKEKNKVIKKIRFEYKRYR